MIAAVRPALVVLLLCCAAAAHAQNAQPQLTQGQDVVSGASIARVAMGFAVAAALAVAAAFVLKRTLPRFGRGIPSGGELRILERATVNAGLRVHVVQFKDQKILVAESRGGIAMVVLHRSEGAAGHE
jgi:flagellar biogenesis protein FliO